MRENYQKNERERERNDNGQEEDVLLKKWKI